MNRRARRLLPGFAWLAALGGLSVWPALAAPSDLSGSVSSTLSGALAPSDATVAWGAEQYANLRLRAAVGEAASFEAAVNLVAASGTAALAPGLTQGPGYGSALEVERLSFRSRGEKLDVQAGLLRLAFGYGQAWSPSDYLLAPNPLVPDARPRGVLGTVVSAYPADTARVAVFGLMGTNPAVLDGSGSTAGAVADLHGTLGSVQTLYTYQVPAAAAQGVQRVGLSLKANTDLGLVVDALYAADPALTGWDALAAAAGLDASLDAGKATLVAQYLFRGPGPLSPGSLVASGRDRQYVLVSLGYRPDDFTGLSLVCVSSLDDASVAPLLSVTHEPFQGLTLSLTLRAALGTGEWGATNTGSRGAATVKAVARF